MAQLPTLMATEPSVSWQQSNNRMHGSAIHREDWCSSRVIGRSKPQASGFVAAWARSCTTARPKSELSTPYACMYRVEFSASHDAGVSAPNGMHHWTAVVPECPEVGVARVFAAPKRVAPDRARMER